MKRFREYLGFPFIFIGWSILIMGLLIGFGLRTTKEFTNTFNKLFLKGANNGQ